MSLVRNKNKVRLNTNNFLARKDMYGKYLFVESVPILDEKRRMEHSNMEKYIFF